MKIFLSSEKNIKDFYASRLVSKRYFFILYYSVTVNYVVYSILIATLFFCKNLSFEIESSCFCESPQSN